VEFDVAATDMISTWASIVGYAANIEAPAYCELTTLAAGAEPLQVGPGPFSASRTEATYLKLTNTSAVVATGEIVLFGRLA